MKRVFNFSAGPAILPEEVLKQAQEEMFDYNGTGMSVMEMSHRSKPFEKIFDDAINDLKEIMNIPDNYKIIFVQGGASMQFAGVPLNLMKNKKADYIVTGQFSDKAAKEAKIFGDVKIVASSKEDNFTYIPDCSDLDIREDADYVYICENNTIYGTKFPVLPNTKGKPLVSDQSSCFLSEPIDVSKYGVIYAGVQKNVGPAGLVVMIIREDLISDELSFPVPTMLKWKTQVDNNSLYNTPNCYSIYICGKVFKWIKNNGGLEAMKQRNIEKANVLYDYLDTTDFYIAHAKKDSRSIMNVTFKTKDPELDAKFIEESKKYNIANIKGHRSVGGMRASIYNAMPKEGVVALVEFMKKFEEENK